MTRPTRKGLVAMPNHNPEHLRMMAAESAAARRTAQLAGLIVTSPPLSPEQVARLVALLRGAQAVER